MTSEQPKVRAAASGFLPQSSDVFSIERVFSLQSPKVPGVPFNTADGVCS
jgi:hypothetical protein